MSNEDAGKGHAVSAPHHHIDYVELPATDLEATKHFYAAAFGWTFQDWGSAYAGFSGAGLDGGFTTESPAGDGGLLVVLFSDDLEASRAGVAAAGGVIVRDIFSFPGGRRFHFADPNGNVLAVWGHDPVAG